jgi:predicted metallopeptidase
MTLEAKDKMESRFSPAPEVREVAKVLIKQHHSHLRSIRIEYVFDHHKKKSGKIVMGTMRIANGLAAYLAADDAAKKVGYTDPFFVMTIVKQIWDHLTEEQRTALVDHELCHAHVWYDDSDNPKLSLRYHDLEEFRDIARRYGEWDRGVQLFAAALRGEEDDETPSMFEEEEEVIDE